MQLTNPTWIHHSGGAIYSIDIHPNGSKIATCGQGNEARSGLVVIWNVDPVISEKKAQDTSCSRLLSRMLHEYCVNCVRWSPDGSLLVCAGDECALSVWEYGGRINSAGMIGSKDAANVEKYRQKYRLYGHTLDVLHAEWSKDARYLASCGMDNNVIVWDANNLPNRMVVLNSTRSGHTGIVKGLSWDPIGKFLASQSADRTVKIWAIDGWQCVKTIVEPFVESSPTTMFCRMDWSPDGTYLVLPCATNNEGPTAQLVRRKDWSMSLDLVGHRKAVTVIRACPRLLHYTTHKGTQLKVTCFAVGSRDKALSVWLIPHIDRPIVVLNRLFKHSILDFSWNGLHLTICSMDGSVKSILFNANEVGRLMSDLEMDEICEKLYSRRLPQYSTATNLAMTTKMNGDDVGTFLKRGTRDGNLPLGYELEMMKAKMDAEKRRNEEESKRRESLMRNRFEAHEHAVTNGISVPSATDSPKTNQLNEEVISSKDQAPVRAIVRPQSAAESPEIVSSQSASELNRPQQPVHNTEQKEVRTKSGKRRIQPVFVASLMAPEEDSSTVSNIQQQLNRSARPSEGIASSNDTVASAMPAATTTTLNVRSAREAELVCATSVTTSSKEDSNQKFSSQSDQMEVDDNSKIVGNHYEKTGKTQTECIAPNSNVQIICQLQEPVELRPIAEQEKVHVVLNEGRSVLLDIPRQTRAISVNISRNALCTVDKVEVLNEYKLNNGICVTKVTAFDNDKTRWCALLEPVVGVVAANSTVTALGCFDRSVYVYSTLSGRLRTTMNVDSVPSSVCTFRSFFSVCSSHGYVYVWDGDECKSVVSRCSLSDICEKESSITRHQISDDGMPVIGLSTNKIFVFSSNLGCWQRIDEACSDATMRRISGPLSSFSSKSVAHQVSLNSLSKLTKRIAPTSIDAALRQCASLGLLERCICNARTLHSSEEYRFYLIEYIHQLVNDGCWSKLSEIMCSICAERGEYICGIRKAVLLRELAEELKSNERSRAILSEISQRFDVHF